MQKRSLHYRMAQKFGLVGQAGYCEIVPQAGAPSLPSPLRTFVLWLLKRGSRRKLRLQNDVYKENVRAAIASVASEIRSHRKVSLPVSGDWVDSGIVVRPGDEVTVFAMGRLFFSRLMEISLGTQTCVWYRIGNSDITRFTRHFEMITAKCEGPLQFCVAEPGGFQSRSGERSENRLPYQKTGEIELQMIEWIGKQEFAVKAAAQMAPSVFGAVAEALDSEQGLPGWDPLWRVGKSAIFSVNESSGSICCHTQGDIGIIQYPVDFPLDEDLQLSWSWYVSELPSDIPEHIRHTHDYLSIAVEFDNGLDLTYMWSSTLKKDTIFQCPLPWWDQRETHWVLRNTEDHMAHWLDEQRWLLEDYQRAIGPSLPKRVVSVWLIAGSRWQNVRGQCEYRAIQIGQPGNMTVVHP